MKAPASDKSSRQHPGRHDRDHLARLQQMAHLFPVAGIDGTTRDEVMVVLQSSQQDYIMTLLQRYCDRAGLSVQINHDFFLDEALRGSPAQESHCGDADICLIPTRNIDNAPLQNITALVLVVRPNLLSLKTAYAQLARLECARFGKLVSVLMTDVRDAYQALRYFDFLREHLVDFHQLPLHLMGLVSTRVFGDRNQEYLFLAPDLRAPTTHQVVRLLSPRRYLDGDAASLRPAVIS